MFSNVGSGQWGRLSTENRDQVRLLRAVGSNPSAAYKCRRQTLCAVLIAEQVLSARIPEKETLQQISLPSLCPRCDGSHGYSSMLGGRCRRIASFAQAWTV